jgi:hypothetical protein
MGRLLDSRGLDVLTAAPKVVRLLDDTLDCVRGDAFASKGRVDFKGLADH